LGFRQLHQFFFNLVEIGFQFVRTGFMTNGFFFPLISTLDQLLEGFFLCFSKVFFEWDFEEGFLLIIVTPYLLRAS
jgi:hypothetical protein